MADGKFEVHIDRTPDDVWAAIGDFGGIASWMPGIDSCTVEDDVRTLQTMGMELQEKLMGHDDATRTTSYSLIKGPMPIEHHLARSEEHTSELQSLMRISYAVFCLKKKTKN